MDLQTGRTRKNTPDRRVGGTMEEIACKINVKLRKKTISIMCKNRMKKVRHVFA